MRIYSGKTKIGKLNRNIDLVIDFDDLFKDKGLKGLKENIEKKIGGLLIILGALTTIVFFSILQTGQNIEILLPLALAVTLYGFYLNRDRDTYDTIVEPKNLYESVKNSRINQIEVENYITNSVNVVLDSVIFNYPNSFLQQTLTQLFRFPKVKEFVEMRIGLEAAKVLKLIKKDLTQDTFDELYKDLFLKLFEVGLEIKVKIIDEILFTLILLKSYCLRYLQVYGVTELELEALISWYGNNLKVNDFKSRWSLLRFVKPKGAVNIAFTSRATPTLDSFSTDFTADAAKGNFFVSTGKDFVVKEILTTLQKESDSAVILIGAAGVGKTSVLKDVATKMVVEDVPYQIQDYRLSVIDISSAMALSGSGNSFLNSLMQIIKEATIAGNVVLTIENLGQLAMLKEDAVKEIVNAIINSVSTNNLKVIATSTTEEYQRKLKNIPALMAVFSLIEIPEPPKEKAMQIILDQAINIEKKYKLKISVEAVRHIVEIGSSILYEKAMPDKGIELLENVAILANSRGQKFVDAQIADEVLSQKAGTKVGLSDEEERQKLANLEELMHKRVIGQVEAVTAVSFAMKRARSGLKKANRNIANFLFFGPTGVGKTEVAKTLAESFYGDEKNMIRLDMSEFSLKESVKRLIGYTDENGEIVSGILSEQVKKKPFSLILFDELDKASPNVLDLFLQILDEGRLTDGSGRIIDFKNTIVIATSNAGSAFIAQSISAGKTYREIVPKAKDNLQKYFRVEFLNRFDEIVMFRALSFTEIQRIAEIKLKLLQAKLKDEGYTFEWDVKTVDQITKLGFNPVFGGRELNRAIQNNIENVIAQGIVEEKIRKGNTIKFSGLEIETFN